MTSRNSRRIQPGHVQGDSAKCVYREALEVVVNGAQAEKSVQRSAVGKDGERVGRAHIGATEKSDDESRQKPRPDHASLHRCDYGPGATHMPYPGPCIPQKINLEGRVPPLIVGFS